jgi:hypothetical protein
VLAIRHVVAGPDRSQDEAYLQAYYNPPQRREYAMETGSED